MQTANALLLPVIGLAASLVTPATTVAAMEAVGRCRAGIAAGVLNAARQTGAALGVAASGALVAASPSFEDGMRAGIVLSAALLDGCRGLVSGVQRRRPGRWRIFRPGVTTPVEFMAASG